MGEVRKSAVLISLTLDGLKNMLSNLDYTKIQLMAVVSDSTENIDVRINEQQIPFYDFSKMDEVINYTKGDDVYYLVCGYRNHLREFGMVARMIRLIGNVSKERIINISLIFEQNWLLNYKLAMQGDLDFFATGISYMMAGLSLNDLPLGCGVNLATSSQDIFYGLETAKRVFLQNHKVRYTFIGLSPYAFSYCMDETFSTSGMTTVYELAWNAGGSSLVNSFIKASLFQSQITISGEYNAEANLKNEVLRLKHMLDLDRELHDILPNGDLVRITKNKKWLKEYIDLCRQNECIPVGGGPNGIFAAKKVSPKCS